MTSATIKVNSLLRDVFRQEDWFDPDGFGLRFSESVAAGLSKGLPVEQAIAAAMNTTETYFFRANPGSKRRLPDALGQALDRNAIQGSGLLGILRDFKRFAERQLVRDLAYSKMEGPCRSHLQAYLASLGRTYREVIAGAGQSDILVLLPDTDEIVEVKVWKGQAYHDDGLQELATYAAAEGLVRGFYVVFEFHKIEPVTPDEQEYREGDVPLDVLYVHIPLTPPSKLGQARRRK